RVLDHLQRVRVLEERLGWNAAPDKARAAKRLLLLDDGNLHSQLRGANCSDVASSPGADDDHVECGGHAKRSRLYSPLPMSDRRKTLLLVDDDERMRETLTGLLRRELRVLRSATGEAALQMMEKEDVDLMILDAHLPGINGFEVLKISKENYPNVEVIATSEVRELDIAIEAMRLG